MIEAVTDGKTLLMISRRKTEPLRDLTKKQVEWCAANLKGFAWPRVQRLKETA